MKETETLFVYLNMTENMDVMSQEVQSPSLVLSSAPQQTVSMGATH